MEVKFKKAAEKADKYQEEYNRTKKSPYLTLIGNRLYFFNVIMQAKGLDEATKNLILGASVALTGIIKGKNPLGIFSEDLMNLSSLLAKTFLVLSKKEPDLGEKQFLKEMILGSLIAIPGFIGFGLDAPRKGSDEKDATNEMLAELMIRMLYKSDLPLESFRIFMQAANMREKEAEIGAKSLEAVSLLFLIALFSRHGGEKDMDLAHAVSERLKKHAADINRYLDDLATETGVNFEAIDKLRNFVAQGEKMLTMKNLDPLIHAIKAWLKSGGYSFENLVDDAAASKRLLTRIFTEVNESARAKDNVITFVG